MSTGQSMLAAGSLIIITFLVISANRVITFSESDRVKGEAFNSAAGIASAVITEALKKKYDTYSNDGTGPYQSVSDFTHPSSLGPSSTETSNVPLPDRWPFKSTAKYDDFDDYKGYVRIVDTPAISGFIVRCQVYYVTRTNLESLSTSKQYFKRLVVTVEHPSYLSVVTLSTVMAY